MGMWMCRINLNDLEWNENRWFRKLLLDREFESVYEFCQFAEISKTILFNLRIGKQHRIKATNVFKIAEALDVEDVWMLKQFEDNGIEVF